MMPFTLETLTKEIERIPNTVNRNLVNEFYSNMTEKDLSIPYAGYGLKLLIFEKC
jgi:hypothetical protein